MEGALVIEVETGLVAVHEGKGRFGGETFKGRGDAIERIGVRLGGGFIFELAGFGGPGPAETPVGDDHLLDESELHAIGGLEAIEVVRHDRFEGFGRFIAHDDMAGEQSVGCRILGRTALALGGDWALGARSIGL